MPQVTPVLTTLAVLVPTTVLQVLPAVPPTTVLQVQLAVLLTTAHIVLVVAVQILVRQVHHAVQPITPVHLILVAQVPTTA